MSRFLIFSDKGGRGGGQFMTLADKWGEGRSGPLHFLLTSYVNSPYSIYLYSILWYMYNI